MASPINVRRWIRALFACAALLAPHAAFAGTMTMFEYDSWHQEIAQEDAYDAVGQIRFTSGGFQFVCSGTLIGDRWVLTAAHCAIGADKMKFQINGKTYSAKRWYAHNRFDGSSLEGLGKGNDIALLRLSEPVTGVRRPPLVGRQYDPTGEKVYIAGFGASGDGLFGEYLPSGTKRAGPNIIDGYFPDSSYKRVVAYDFDGPPGLFDDPDSSDDFPITLEYSGAHGDSGGGIFDERGRLVAVTSYGDPGNPIFGSVAGSTNVAVYRSWIKQVKRYDQGLRDSVRADMGRPGDAIPDEALGEHGHRSQYFYLAVVPEPGCLLVLSSAAAVCLLRRRAR